jgi:hypothetical protein
MRRSLCLSLVMVMFALSAGDALAKKKGKALKPVTATVTNQCTAKIELNLGGVDVVVETGQTSPSLTIPGAAGDAYPYTFKGATLEPRYVFITAGGPYNLAFSNCTGADAADLTTRNMSERPAGLSPNAAAQIRFRASSSKGQSLPNLHYRAGDAGRFRPLAVSFTTYKESAAGEYGYGLKLKSKRMRFQGRMMPGRQLELRNGKVSLEPGKKYLIEAGVVGTKIFIKFEDEGWNVK